MTGILQAAGGWNPKRNLYGIIQELNLTSNLNFVLDTADTASYDGSSQTWTDATGNGFNFFRGTTSGSDATDPTFNGTAGLPNESTYFSFDGGDFFKETAAHTFAANWHKNNGVFTIVAVIFFVDGGARTVFNNKTSLAAGSGIMARVTAAENLSFAHSTSDAPASETVNGTTVIPASAWSMVAYSYNEATPAMTFVVNSTSEVVATTASTATVAASTALHIGAIDDTPNSPMASGERIACIAGWSTNLSTTSIGQIYERLKARRFTSLP